MSKGAYDREAELAALSDLLDRKGADEARWSGEDHARFPALIAADTDARRLVAEARALDRLMTAAAGVPQSTRHAALLDRITALAAAEAFGAVTRASIEPSRSNVVPIHARPAAPARVRRVGFDGWATGLIAASLLVGVMSGLSGVSDPVMRPVVASLADVADEDADVIELAFSDGDVASSEEDVW